ncbi:MAG: primosomal protein N', partial [Acetatifactor sp.]|nr:primosomal protein N' [Acetatifactor sp.]
MREQYADIIVDISHEKLDKSFQYRVPPHLRDRLEPGMCVQIPFGNGNRLIKGYVLAVGDECKFDPARTKELLGIAEKDADATGRMVALAAWIRQNYGSTMIQALKTVLPAKKTVKKQEKRFVEVRMNREELRSLLGESLRKKQPAKARLLTALLEQWEETAGAIPYQWITGKLNVAAGTVNSLEKAGAIRVVTTEQFRNPVRFSEEAARERRRLSPDQQHIVDA